MCILRQQLICYSDLSRVCSDSQGENDKDEAAVIEVTPDTQVTVFLLFLTVGIRGFTAETCIKYAEHVEHCVEMLAEEFLTMLLVSTEPILRFCLSKCCFFFCCIFSH